MVESPDAEIKRQTIDAVWNKYGVGELVAKEEWRSGGRWFADDIYEDLQAGNFQLWLVLEDRRNIKAALITDIRPYPNGFRACIVLMVVGEEPRSWIPLKSVLEDWARKSGCEAIEAIGRKGWKRVLSSDWEMTGAFYEKRL